jgi:hypothetical protein
MNNIIFWQWLTLSLFVSFMGFCFCDGFKLHILRKLLWFVTFIALVILSLKLQGGFDLTFILPPAILLAILLCVYEKKRQSIKNR